MSLCFHVLLPQNETEFFICSRTNVDFGGVNTTEEYFYAIRNNTDNSTKPDSSVVKCLYTCGTIKIHLIHDCFFYIVEVKWLQKGNNTITH